MRQELREAEKKLRLLSQETEDSLSLMRELQSQAFPLSVPGAPHVRFSGKCAPAEAGVSGDFFDLLPLKDSMKFGIILAAWESYALASLFLTSFLKLSSGLSQPSGASHFLSKLLEEISSSLSQSAEPDIFYAVFDRRDLSLDCAWSGSPFAWLSPAKGRPRRICPDLAAQRGPVARRRLELSQGDAVLICSPGALERSNSQGEMFGPDRVSGILKGSGRQSALALRQEALFQIERHGQSALSKKDQTALALKIQDSALKLAG